MRPIHLLANNYSLQDYLAIKDHFFYKEPASGFDALVFKDVKPPFWEAAREAYEQRISTWPTLIAFLKGSAMKIYIRNCPYDSVTALKAIVSIAPYDSQIAVGFYVGFMGNLIGFYFTHADVSKNNRPIFQHTYEMFLHEVSYFPFCPEHMALKNFILDNIRQYFAGFSIFNPEFADVKIDKVQTQAQYYENIDLFQVLFDSQISMPF